MTGADMKNLRMFRRLCGDQGLSCVVLATTMWSSHPTRKEVQREQELISRTEFWAGMISKGSTVFRQDYGLASATKIIQFILAQRHKITLQIQEEMANGKSLDQTSAGQEVQAEIESLKARHNQEMQRLREEMREAQERNNVRAQREIAAVRADLEKKIEKEESKRHMLRVSMKELQEQRNEEMRRRQEQMFEQRQRILEQEMAHKEAMSETRAELKLLRAKGGL